MTFAQIGFYVVGLRDILPPHEMIDGDGPQVRRFWAPETSAHYLAAARRAGQQAAVRPAEPRARSGEQTLTDDRHAESRRHARY